MIPARGGSKGIPNKNIVNLDDHPLIAYSIAAAKASKYISRVIVSTDSKKIADVARQYEAEIPFMRPQNLANDTATDLAWVKHSINYFKEDEFFLPDLIVHLRPTTPLRNAELIDDAILKFMQMPDATSLRSAHQLEESPYKMFVMDGDYYKPFMQGEGEFFNKNRQEFPHVFAPNGYVDILRVSHIVEKDNLHGDKILAYQTPKVIEVDTPENIKELERCDIKSLPIYSHLTEMLA